MQRGIIHTVRKLIFISALAFFSCQAHAECFVDSTWREVFARMSGGVITVKPTDPVGTTLREFITDVPVVNSGAPLIPTYGGELAFRSGQCTEGGTYHYEVLKGSPVAGLQNVFSTNIPGIGIRFSLHWQVIDAPHSEQIYTQGSSVAIYKQPGTVNIVWPANTFFHTEIIKTAMTTGSGTVDPGVYSTLYYGGSGPGRRVISSTLGARVITIISPTCDVDSGSAYQRVMLKTVPVSNFKGVRSTAGDTPFNIKINCNAGTGNASPLTVSLAFQGTAGRNTSLKDGVLAQSLNSTDAAKNVGVQLIRSDSNLPITLGGESIVGNTKNGQYIVPFIARYYQLSSEQVTPGKVAASTTFLLQYK